jgi:hypothetical protein
MELRECVAMRAEDSEQREQVAHRVRCEEPGQDHETWIQDVKV